MKDSAHYTLHTSTLQNRILRAMTKNQMRAAEIAGRVGLDQYTVRLELLRLKTAGRVNSMRVRLPDGSGWARFMTWYRRS